MQLRNWLLRVIPCVFVAAAAWGQGADEVRGYPAVAKAREGEMRPHVWIRDQTGRFRPDSGSGVGGFLAPSDIDGAYGIPANGGSGVTVAIVDAYNSQTVASDLATFSTQYNLPACTTANGCLTVHSFGTRSATGTGWDIEIALDVQWVHSVAPLANILLVEASSNSTSALMTAVSYAASHASIVSMSWGGSEFNGETGSSYDGTFNVAGVTFLASSGDTGAVVEWPSSSQYVAAVGGTNLTLATGGGYGGETAWSDSGGGCSAYEPQITAQKGFVPSSCTKRGVPDVAMDGGGSSAVSVIAGGTWYGVYGTSLAVQLWAGLTAVLKGQLPSMAHGLSDLYVAGAGAPSSSPYTLDYHDITSGSACHSTFRQSVCNAAGPGWDFVTGLGSPVGGSILPYLVGHGN